MTIQNLNNDLLGAVFSFLSSTELFEECCRVSSIWNHVINSEKCNPKDILEYMMRTVPNSQNVLPHIQKRIRKQTRFDPLQESSTFANTEGYYTTIVSYAPFFAKIKIFIFASYPSEFLNTKSIFLTLQECRELKELNLMIEEDLGDKLTKLIDNDPSYFAHLEKLSLTGCRLPVNQLETIVSSCKKLQELQLTCCEEYNDTASGLESVATNNPGCLRTLRSLTLFSNNASAEQIYNILLACPNLQTLQISSSPEQGNKQIGKGLLRLAQHNPDCFRSLRLLTLFSRDISNEAVQAIRGHFLDCQFASYSKTPIGSCLIL